MISINITTSKGLKPEDIFKRIEKDMLSGKIGDVVVEAMKEDLKSAVHKERYRRLFPELSVDWKRYKKEKGYDRRMFMAEGHYLNMIQTDADGKGLIMGFTQGQTHPRTGEKLSKIARDLEMGNQAEGIPPRELWRTFTPRFFKRGEGGKAFKEAFDKSVSGKL